MICLNTVTNKIFKIRNLEKGLTKDFTKKFNRGE